MSQEFPKEILELAKTKTNFGNLCRVVEFYKDKMPPFWDLPSLSLYLGAPVGLLLALTESDMWKCYKHYRIDKKTKRIVGRDFPGNVREINAPILPLKKLQKRLLSAFIDFPFNPCNNGFIKGRGIVDAVNAVKDGETLIHIDLEKFFDNHSSLYVKMGIKDLFSKTYGVELDNTILNVLVALVCMGNKLPQGSPISPFLVVVLNKDLDDRVCEVANEFNLNYSRYADDLSFSGHIDNKEISTFIKKVVDAVHPFKINFKKLGIMRDSAKPILTGFKLRFSKGLDSKLLGVIKNDIAQKANICKNMSAWVDNKLTQSVPSKLIIKSPLLNSMDLECIPLAVKCVEDVVRKHTDIDFTIKPIMYYIQSVKSLLGLHIHDGKVNFPRKEYEHLRLIAMLMGRQRAIKNVQFILGKRLEELSSEGQNLYSFNATSNTEELLMLTGSLSILNMYALSGKIKAMTSTYRNLLDDPLNRKVFNGMLSHIKNVDPAKFDKLILIEKTARNKAVAEISNIIHHTYPRLVLKALRPN